MKDYLRKVYKNKYIKPSTLPFNQLIVRIQLLEKMFIHNNEVFLKKLEDILYMDDELYQNLSQNNITFTKEFDWKKIVKKIEMLYAQ